jgi:hypothetical protein
MSAGSLIFTSLDFIDKSAGDSLNAAADAESGAAPDLGAPDVDKDAAILAVGMIDDDIEMAGPDVATEADNNAGGGKSDS